MRRFRTFGRHGDIGSRYLLVVMPTRGKKSIVAVARERTRRHHAAHYIRVAEGRSRRELHNTGVAQSPIKQRFLWPG